MCTWLNHAQQRCETKQLTYCKGAVEIHKRCFSLSKRVYYVNIACSITEGNGACSINKTNTYMHTYTHIIHNTYVHTHIHTYIHTYIHNTYTGCPGGNVPDFGRMFLKLKYTDITKNTYIRSWTVTEIKARGSVIFLQFHVLYLVRVTYYPYTAHVRPCLQPDQARSRCDCNVKCLEP